MIRNTHCNLDSGLVARLKAEASDGFSRCAWGGAERGGLLVGERVPDGITVTGYAEVKCEHANGPSWELDEDDERRLMDAVEAAQAEGQLVVGWYQTISYRTTAISEEDRALWAKLFPEPWQVALVIKRS